MADDIVTRLRDVQPYGLIEDHRVTTDAADEIERLWAAGDALADAMRSSSDAGWDDAIDAWMEARHG